MGVWVGVSVAVGIFVGDGVRVGVGVNVAVGSGVLVGLGVAVGGNGVGVLDGTTVGNDWVGVGSRVVVGEPTTRVDVGVGGLSTVGEVGVEFTRRVGVGKVKINWVGVGASIGGGTAVNVANPRQ